MIIRYTSFVIVLCIALVSAPAFAQGQPPIERTVDCDKGRSITEAIASLNQNRPAIIHVTGTCVEDVQIRDFMGPSLLLDSLDGATITPDLSRIAIGVADSRNISIGELDHGFELYGTVAFYRCQSCDLEGNTLATETIGISISSSDANLEYNTVTLSEGSTAVTVSNGSYAVLRGNKISSLGATPSSTGLAVRNNSAAVVAAAPSLDRPAIIDGFRYGIIVDQNSHRKVAGPSACDPLDNPCMFITNSLEQGVWVMSSRATIANALIQGNNEGIWLEDGSTATITRTRVVGNGAHGIVATHNSHATIGSQSGVSGNPEGGVIAANLSTVRFGSGSTEIMANGSKDYACDASSRITGTVHITGAINIACTDVDPDSTPLP